MKIVTWNCNRGFRTRVDALHAPRLSMSEELLVTSIQRRDVRQEQRYQLLCCQASLDQQYAVVRGRAVFRLVAADSVRRCWT